MSFAMDDGVHRRHHGANCDRQSKHSLFPDVSEMDNLAGPGFTCKGDQASMWKVDVTQSLSHLAEHGADHQVDVLGTRLESTTLHSWKTLQEAVD